MLDWLEQSIEALKDKEEDYPSDVIQLKNLQKNLLVFKQDIMHAKMTEKYKIDALYDEITVSIESILVRLLRSLGRTLI